MQTDSLFQCPSQLLHPLFFRQFIIDVKGKIPIRNNFNTAVLIAQKITGGKLLNITINRFWGRDIKKAEIITDGGQRKFGIYARITQNSLDLGSKRQSPILKPVMQRFNA